jgi:hypothetical protein
MENTQKVKVCQNQCCKAKSTANNIVKYYECNKYTLCQNCQEAWQDNEERGERLERAEQIVSDLKMERRKR